MIFFFKLSVPFLFRIPRHNAAILMNVSFHPLFQRPMFFKVHRVFTQLRHATTKRSTNENFFHIIFDGLYLRFTDRHDSLGFSKNLQMLLRRTEATKKKDFNENFTIKS